MSVYSTKTSRHGLLQVRHGVVNLVKAESDRLRLDLHQPTLPDLQPDLVLLFQTLEVVKRGLTNSFESHVDVVTQLETALDDVEELGGVCINHLVGIGDGSIWRVRNLVDNMRKHCVDSVDALLSYLGDDFVEGLERVWGGSFGETCKVAILGTVENVLVDER